MSTDPLGGVLLVDKPAGITSHGVVALVRRALDVRRVGHAGTLDPAATGLLVLGVGPGTRLLTFLVGLDKRYDATIRLGVATTSDDADGSVTARVGCPADVDVAPALGRFRGLLWQRPSDVSAVKVAGVRAYRRAREGDPVRLPERKVTVFELQVTGTRPSEVDGVPVLDVDVNLSVSSGTYVRAIARDLGEELGVGGHLVALRRTAVGPFDVARAAALDAVDASLLLPLGAVAASVLPSVHVAADDVSAVRHGTRLPCDPASAVPPTAKALHRDGSHRAGSRPDSDAPGGGQMRPIVDGRPVALLDAGGVLLAVATCSDGRWQYRYVVPS